MIPKQSNNNENNSSNPPEKPKNNNFAGFKNKIRNYVAAGLALWGAAEMQGQTDNRPLNMLQVSQVNALGGNSFDAQGDATIEATLNKHAREMAASYGVHIDLAYTIVRINYLATGLTTTGNESNDLGNLTGWRQTNFPGADPRDLNAAFYLGNAYGGAAQQGPDANGYRYTTIASPQASWILDHEDKHTVDALNSTHDEKVTDINFTATNIPTGTSSTLSDGYTNGSPAGTVGTRLQYISVSNAKNTGNPANGGDGNTKHIGEYFGDEYEISAPYTELQNNTGAGNTADKVADYYAATGPGRDFRHESLPLMDTPIAQVSGTTVTFTNVGDYEITYPSTTNPSFQSTYFVEGIVEGYLYNASNPTDGNQIAGPIDVNDSFSGLAAGDYVLGVYEKYGNREVQFSAPFTIETGLSVENQELAGFKMYPNPTTGIVTIENKNGYEISTIEILDKTGKEIYKLNGSQQINLENLANGLYFIRITDKNGAYHNTKIIKK